MHYLKTYLPFILAALNVIIHLLVVNTFEYHRDELLYFSLGTHPAFGYMTVPPLIGWIAGGIQFMFGYSVFAVKLFPALLSGIFLLLAIRVCKELGGGYFAQLLTGVGILITPFNLRTFHLFQPVCIDIFCWTLIFYWAIRFVRSRENQYLLFLGLTAGAALLNKYLVALLLICLLLSIALTEHRKLYQNRYFYLALGVASVIFLPNLIWQALHDFPVLRHMQALNARQLVNVSRLSFLSDQLLSPFAGSLLFIPGFFILWKRKPYRFVLFTAVLVIAILVIVRGKSYYTLGVFPVMMAAGAIFWENWLAWSKWLQWVFVIALLVLNSWLVPMGLPVYKPDDMVQYFRDLEEDAGLVIGRTFEDGTVHPLPQDYADQLGWKELTLAARSAWNSIPEGETGIIYCENYGQAGAITVIGKQYGLPEPLCFNESFLYWLPDSLGNEVQHLIYINDELGEDVAALFQTITLAGKIENPYAREYGTSAWLCSQPKYPLHEFWDEVMQRVMSDPMRGF